MKPPSFSAVLAFVGVMIVSPTDASLPSRVLHEFSVGTWIENLYVRANGDLLVTSLSPNASLYHVSDPAGLSPKTTLVKFFSGIDGLLGVTETLPGVFVTFGGNFSNAVTGVNGSFSVFEVDLRKGPDKAVVQVIATLHEAVFLNGVANVPSLPTSLLIGDSTLGLVFYLDTLTGRYDVAIQVPQMAVVAGAAGAIGINGLHVHNGYLYWTNGFGVTVYRLAIDDLGRPVPGAEVETVAKLSADAPLLDDMTTGPLNGDTVWATTDPGNTVLAVRPDGSIVTAEGSETQLTVAGATSCKFGRTAADWQTLYVTTNGGLAAPVNGTLTEGGSVIAVDTRSFNL